MSSRRDTAAIIIIIIATAITTTIVATIITVAMDISSPGVMGWLGRRGRGFRHVVTA